MKRMSFGQPATYSDNTKERIIRRVYFMALVYYSVRMDSGNDHSKANPSFVAGIAGGFG